MDNRRRLLDLMVAHNHWANALDGSGSREADRRNEQVTQRLKRIAREISALQAQDNAD
jgi:hypothetical protein